MISTHCTVLIHMEQKLIPLVPHMISSIHPLYLCRVKPHPHLRTFSLNIVFNTIFHVEDTKKCLQHFNVFRLGCSKRKDIVFNIFTHHSELSLRKMLKTVSSNVGAYFYENVFNSVEDSVL